MNTCDLNRVSSVYGGSSRSVQLAMFRGRCDALVRPRRRAPSVLRTIVRLCHGEADERAASLNRFESAPCNNLLPFRLPLAAQTFVTESQRAKCDAQPRAPRLSPNQLNACVCVCAGAVRRHHRQIEIPGCGYVSMSCCCQGWLVSGRQRASNPL